jgi:hypothetical protein
MAGSTTRTSPLLDRDVKKLGFSSPFALAKPRLFVCSLASEISLRVASEARSFLVPFLCVFLALQQPATSAACYLVQGAWQTKVMEAMAVLPVSFLMALIPLTLDSHRRLRWARGNLLASSK